MSSRGEHKPRRAVIDFGEDDFAVPVVQPTSPADVSAAATVNCRPLYYISLGSGSSGNCAYVGNEDGGILVDAGIDPEQVWRELARHGITPMMVRGIILTHDHRDHVHYVYTIVRKNKHIAIYCTRRLIAGLLRRSRISRRVQDYVHHIYIETPFEVAGFTITAFTTSHDGSDNMGFEINYDGRSLVVATDMGEITPRAEYYMSNANYLMIESNYDLKMLDEGLYPEDLKHRVRGPKGHLDNEVAAAFVASHYNSKLSHVWLCHLSADNNRPDIAVGAMTRALTALGVTVGDGSDAPEHRDRDVQVYALPRYDASIMFVLK